MQKYYLTEITTRDQLIHQGIFFKPKKVGKRALLWVHGLTDHFYGDVNLYEEFAQQSEKTSIAFAVFNNRGHDVVTRISKIDPKTPKGSSSFLAGAAYEKFTESVFDIDGGITFLTNQGYSEIVIAGSSTGANKVCYFAGTQSDQRLIGVILVSAISDVAIHKKALGKKYAPALQRIKKLNQTKIANKLLDDIDYLPLTPHRYLSLYQENGAEDVFPYYQKKPQFKIFSQISIPLLIILGEKDEYADLPVKQIAQIYSHYHKSANFNAVVIPNAFHSLKPQEKLAAQTIFTWIRSL